MAVAPKVALTIRVPVRDDTRRPLGNAILREELLHDLVHRRGKALFILTILMTFPPDVPTLIILEVVSTGGEVASASIACFPLRVLQNLGIDGRVLSKLPAHFHIPPPSCGVVHGLLGHAGSVRGTDPRLLPAHLLCQVGVHTPRSRQPLFFHPPPLRNEVLGTTQSFCDLGLRPPFLPEVDSSQPILVILVTLGRVLLELPFTRKVRLVELGDFFPSFELHPPVGLHHLVACEACVLGPAAAFWL
mmetsp:Transcript_33558/g.78024  ORF Transcript_33558/g.78024 Transcript_33558/m.78024 type:complete len:246 (+) Transcript_33558:2137-2874(+)